MPSKSIAESKPKATTSETPLDQAIASVTEDPITTVALQTNPDQELANGAESLAQQAPTTTPSIPETKSRPTVQVTATNSSTLFLISEDTSESKQSDSAIEPSTNAKSVPAVLASQDKSSSPAEATLLAPQVLGQSDTTEDVALNVTSEQEVASPTNTKQTELSPTDTQVVSATNRYAATTSPTVVNTMAPNADPSELLAIAKSFQAQSTEQMVRAMRQTAATMTSNTQWQPLQPNTQSASTSGSTLPSISAQTQSHQHRLTNSTSAPQRPVYSPVYGDAGTSKTKRIRELSTSSQTIIDSSAANRFQPVFPNLVPTKHLVHQATLNSQLMKPRISPLDSATSNISN